MAFTPQQHREYRAKLKERGICTICHKRKTGGNSVCSICAERNNKRNEIARRDMSKCHDCQKDLDEYSIMTGRRNCSYCLERTKIHKIRKKQYETNKS